MFTGKDKTVKTKKKGLFDKFDFKPKDIPRAIVVHELLGIFMLALTWSAAYYIQFSKIPAIQNQLNRVSSMIPQAVSNGFSKISFIDKEMLATAANSRIGRAYIESSCFRKMIRPMTIPTKLFVTYKIVKALGTFDREAPVAGVPLVESTAPVTNSITPKLGLKPIKPIRLVNLAPSTL